MEQYEKPQSSRVLSIGTVHQDASLLGLFNIGDRGRIELVDLRSVRDIMAGQKYVVRRHTAGQIFGPLHSESILPLVSVHLEPTRYEFLTACPVLIHQGVETAILGLLEKFSGAAAVTSIDLVADRNGNTTVLSVCMKAIGTLGKLFQERYVTYSDNCRCISFRCAKALERRDHRSDTANW